MKYFSVLILFGLILIDFVCYNYIRRKDPDFLKPYGVMTLLFPKNKQWNTKGNDIKIVSVLWTIITILIIPAFFMFSYFWSQG